MIQILKEGEYFGELRFTFDQPRVAFAKSIGTTSLLTIGKMDFSELIQNFPDDFETFCMLKDQYKINNNMNMLQTKCYICRRNHLVQNCYKINFIPDKEKVILQHNYSQQHIISIPWDRQDKEKYNSYKDIYYTVRAQEEYMVNQNKILEQEEENEFNEQNNSNYQLKKQESNFTYNSQNNPFIYQQQNQVDNINNNFTDNQSIIQQQVNQYSQNGIFTKQSFEPYLKQSFHHSINQQQQQQQHVFNNTSIGVPKTPSKYQNSQTHHNNSNPLDNLQNDISDSISEQSQDDQLNSSQFQIQEQIQTTAKDQQNQEQDQGYGGGGGNGGGAGGGGDSESDNKLQSQQLLSDEKFDKVDQQQWDQQQKQVYQNNYMQQQMQLKKIDSSFDINEIKKKNIQQNLLDPQNVNNQQQSYHQAMKQKKQYIKNKLKIKNMSADYQYQSFLLEQEKNTENNQRKQNGRSMIGYEVYQEQQSKFMQQLQKIPNFEINQEKIQQNNEKLNKNFSDSKNVYENDTFNKLSQNKYSENQLLQFSNRESSYIQSINQNELQNNNDFNNKQLLVMTPSFQNQRKHQLVKNQNQFIQQQKNEQYQQQQLQHKKQVQNQQQQKVDLYKIREIQGEQPVQKGFSGQFQFQVTQSPNMENVQNKQQNNVNYFIKQQNQKQQQGQGDVNSNIINEEVQLQQPKICDFLDIENINKNNKNLSDNSNQLRSGRKRNSQKLMTQRISGQKFRSSRHIDSHSQENYSNKQNSKDRDSLEAKSYLQQIQQKFEEQQKRYEKQQIMTEWVVHGLQNLLSQQNDLMKKQEKQLLSQQQIQVPHNINYSNVSGDVNSYHAIPKISSNSTISIQRNNSKQDTKLYGRNNNRLNTINQYQSSFSPIQQQIYIQQQQYLQQQQQQQQGQGQGQSQNDSQQQYIIDYDSNVPIQTQINKQIQQKQQQKNNIQFQVTSKYANKWKSKTFSKFLNKNKQQQQQVNNDNGSGQDTVETNNNQKKQRDSLKTEGFLKNLLEQQGEKEHNQHSKRGSNLKPGTQIQGDISKNNSAAPNSQADQQQTSQNKKKQSECNVIEVNKDECEPIFPSQNTDDIYLAGFNNYYPQFNIKNILNKMRFQRKEEYRDKRYHLYARAIRRRQVPLLNQRRKSRLQKYQQPQNFPTQKTVGEYNHQKLQNKDEKNMNPKFSSSNNQLQEKIIKKASQIHNVLALTNKDKSSDNSESDYSIDSPNEGNSNQKNTKQKVSKSNIKSGSSLNSKNKKIIKKSSYFKK